ncbi:MAG: toll/interleukin-1 receptor domain-containing protein [Chloroflexota bacterium]
MDNPLELPAPQDPIERVHELARDIAYGAVHKIWTSHLRVEKSNDQAVFVDKGLNEGLRSKWGEYHNYYSVHLLVSFGYITKSNIDEGYKEVYVVFYDLTPKAFALLGKPAKTPSIFISHKQDQSSALALLIEARLKLQDSNIEVFIDRDIPPGEKWNGFLKDQVKKSKYLICLLTLETLTSKGVKDEIEWALANPDCKIIPLCHNWYNFSVSFPTDHPRERVIPKELIQILSEWQAILVEQEKAEYYDFAILKLLNRLGYSSVK